MSADPKRKIIDGRRRLLTIHDGARLTPALVRVLEVLADEANELLEADLEHESNGREARAKASTYKLGNVDPILVARADGLAIYVAHDGRIA